jgi:flagellar biogenesis protein FliO
MSFSSWILAVLALVAIAIPLVLHSARRLPIRNPSAFRLELLGQLPFSPRERVVLVRAADRVLLLGVTQQQVTLLNQFDNLPLDEAAVADAVRPTGFAGLLREAVALHTGRRA